MKPLILALFLAATLPGCSTSPVPVTNEPAAMLPTQRYQPPEGKNERKVLAQMHGQLTEAQGAYGRGTDRNDYLRVFLHAYRGDPQELARFFRWSYHDTWSAAGGEMNTDLTVSLFYHWGDRRFAEELSRQSPEVRRGVGSHLWLRPEAIPTFAKKFPATTRAALLFESINS